MTDEEAKAAVLSRVSRSVDSWDFVHMRVLEPEKWEEEMAKKLKDREPKD